MNPSRLFSHDDSSVWDPKALGQILHISEEQSQILNNLPEWLKVSTKNSLNLGIEKESTIWTSQTSEVGSQVSEIRNIEVHQNLKKNIELFDKSLQYRRKILNRFELNTRKRNKSSSLIEIGKHNNKDLPSLTALKRTSSNTDICLKAFDPTEFCVKSNSTVKRSLNITYSLSTPPSENGSKDIFSSTLEVHSSKVLDQNQSIPEYKSTKAKLGNLKLSCEGMEVITQPPVNINALVNINEAEQFELTHEKQVELSYVEPEKLITLQNDKQVDSNECGNNEEKSDHVNSAINSQSEEVISKLMDENPILLPSKDANKELKNLQCEKQVILNEHENGEKKTDQVSSVNPKKDIESNDLVKDKMALDSYMKQPLFENNESNDNEENINVDPEKVRRSKASKEISEESCGLQSLSEKHSCDVVNVQGFNKSAQAIDISNTSSPKLEAAETPLSVKRKADSKKSSHKKRKCLQEKKGEADARSLKKAGDITYSFEDIEILLDIIKQFL